MTNAEYFFRKYYGWWISAALHILVILMLLLPNLVLHQASFSSGTRGISVESYSMPVSATAEAPKSSSEQSEPLAEADALNDDGTANRQAGGSLNPFSGNDTAGLANYYSEKSLNVRIRYPAGWVFADQPKNGKLDAITFFGMRSSTGAVPYIHFEVKEKYLFNPALYKYKIDKGRYALYYDDEKIIENQVTQIVYARTESDEDYSIKMSVQGEQSYKELRLAFFAMIESFKFGEM